MGEERVIVRQNRNFETEFLAPDPRAAESQEPRPVGHLQELTPYGMLLAGLGSCTAVVLHTYARHHGLNLEEVELDLRYERVFREDCENCEEIGEYRERIRQDIRLKGDMKPGDREKLFRISRHCPIHKMFQSGIPVESHFPKAG